MTNAQANVGEPVASRIARMKQSLARLEALERFFPDLTVKSDAMKDIYQSKLIWKHVDQLEVIKGSYVLKVLPYKDIQVTFNDHDKTYQSEYRIYTDPMEIILVGEYWNSEEGSLSKGIITTIQFQDYMSVLGTNLYSDKLLKQIEYELYLYIKRTIMTAPSRYKIENDHFLPDKLQTLITFS